MSVRLGLLALLAQQPMYGAQLRAEFERRTGGTWPLNVGQIYTTLARLQRDGLVVGEGEPDDDGRIAYRLTELGNGEVALWWSTPVRRDGDPRDELTIKLALAVTMPGVDVVQIVQTQRTTTLQDLQRLTRLKRQATDCDDLAWELVLERHVFAAESQVRWLDHVEARLSREARRVRAHPAPASTDPVATPAPAQVSR